MKKENQEGLTVKKENTSEWYTQVIEKAELADYSSIKGFMIIRPNAYAIWESITAYFNKILEKKDTKNAYFPMLIPESFFVKEAEHAEGFSPELAYLEEKTEEGEKLALRPTSETIMYDSFSKWVRSWRDLPQKLNQWCNIIRWEVKQTKPFLRTREFLWQEGHCAFETKQEAEKNMTEMLEAYKELIETQLGVAVITGEKTIKERFPGALTTMTLEAFMPDGKALQCGTSHNLGQNFAKSFNVQFKDRNQKDAYVWQTSWGVSTRLIGALILMHGDDKGIILPPKVAKNKLAIVPILIKNKKEAVLKKVKEFEKELSEYNPIVDTREEYSPGWKFNEWELKGIPIRVEIGPKDIEKGQVVLVRRDTNEKIIVKEKQIKEVIKKLLEEIQENLFQSSRKKLKESIKPVNALKDCEKLIKQKKIALAPFCGDAACEDMIKEKLQGVTSRCIHAKEKGNKPCIACKKKAKYTVYFSKSY